MKSRSRAGTRTDRCRDRRPRGEPVLPPPSCPRRVGRSKDVLDWNDVRPCDVLGELPTVLVVGLRLLLLWTVESVGPGTAPPSSSPPERHHETGTSSSRAGCLGLCTRDDVTGDPSLGCPGTISQATSASLPEVHGPPPAECLAQPPRERVPFHGEQVRCRHQELRRRSETFRERGQAVRGATSAHGSTPNTAASALRCGGCGRCTSRSQRPTVLAVVLTRVEFPWVRLRSSRWLPIACPKVMCRVSQRVGGLKTPRRSPIMSRRRDRTLGLRWLPAAGRCI